jgi:hypothetical protein
MIVEDVIELFGQQSAWMAMTTAVWLIKYSVFAQSTWRINIFGRLSHSQYCADKVHADRQVLIQ